MGCCASSLSRHWMTHRLRHQHCSPQKSTRRPKHEFLTDEERARVSITWSRLTSKTDPQVVGEKIFLRIFHLNPETKNAFYAFRNLRTKEELIKSSLFKSHAIRFMLAIEVTMKNLDALDVVVQPTLHHLGTRHTNFKGFHPEYLETFEHAMEEVWLEELGRWRFDKVSRKAWRKIFHMITSSVLAGYTEGAVEKQRQEVFNVQQKLLAEAENGNASKPIDR